MHQGVSDDGFPADKLQGVMARDDFAVAGSYERFSR